jgi:hypothetical protein
VRDGDTLVVTRWTGWPASRCILVGDRPGLDARAWGYAC